MYILGNAFPFLDHRIIEFSGRSPNEFKLHGSVSKRIIRNLLQRYIPTALTDRPKMGFSIPLGSWLRATLREWAEELLSEKRLSEQGYFNVSILD